jgi:hypothetical protein
MIAGQSDATRQQQRALVAPDPPQPYPLERPDKQAMTPTTSVDSQASLRQKDDREHDAYQQ